MEKLIYLLKLNQEQLKEFLYDYLKEKKMKPIYSDGYIYAEGDIPILVVAHMDTVFEQVSKKLLYNKKEDKIYNELGGLGGDDRCGIYAIMKLLDKNRPHVLFTEDEEKGCIGAIKAVNKLNKPKVKYIIEFDRRGKDDCVFYDCGNKKFKEYVESFGFKTNYGSCSDISILGSAWDIASVNLSSGYYNEHTKKEYVVFSELENTIKRAKKMIKCLNKSPYFDYQEILYSQFYFPYTRIMSDIDEILLNNKILEENILTKEKNKKDIKKLVLKNNKNGENNGNA